MNDRCSPSDSSTSACRMLPTSLLPRDPKGLSLHHAGSTHIQGGHLPPYTPVHPVSHRHARCSVSNDRGSTHAPENKMRTQAVCVAVLAVALLAVSGAAASSPSISGLWRSGSGYLYQCEQAPPPRREMRVPGAMPGWLWRAQRRSHTGSVALCTHTHPLRASVFVAGGCASPVAGGLPLSGGPGPEPMGCARKCLWATCLGGGIRHRRRCVPPLRAALTGACLACLTVGAFRGAPPPPPVN